VPSFGGDPDTPEKEWDENPRPKRNVVNPKLMYLVNYFAYHKDMKSMTRMCPPEDKRILSYTFGRLLKQGYTEKSLQFIVDRFFQSWAKDAERPAMLFSTTKVLSKLLVEAEMSHDDPMIQWLLEGMPNVGPVYDPKSYRKAVLLACQESLRYPDVIADILRLGFRFSTAYEMLMALEQVVRYNLAGKPYDKKDVLSHLALLDTLTLPQELRSPVPSPKAVRPMFDKMHLAVAASKNVKGDDW